MAPKAVAVLVGVSVALAVAVGAFVLAAYWAELYYSQLSKIPGCEGGLGGGGPSCQRTLPGPNVGLTFVQLGQGQLVGGEYVYRFLVSPEPPPQENASALSVAAYNLSSGQNLTLLSVTLAYPNGTLFASYGAVDGNWSTTSTVAITEVSVLTLTSLADLAGQGVSFANEVTRVVFGLLIA